ncbi:hypothetical protein GQ53DRAFT_748157 [Thozetella sp. PMI_491]|nr:hypothetical protein GQ53DRAFT_748157 [Thozetella sp. PMI_491]
MPGSGRRERNLVLVLCGGVGHSTSFLYEAVAKHPRYKEIADAAQGLPESRVIQKIAEQWFGLKVLDAPPQEPQSQSGLRIVVEDRSTNCGANASESRKVLETFGIHSPRSVIVVQDPTMCRRTVASFEKVYEDHASPPRFVSWPTFVPRVAVRGESPEATDIWSSLEFASFDSQGASLWSMSRFVDLLMGEIPRLRDDEDGYGPNGKGFIAHVDVPSVAEAAWKQLDALVEKGKEERVRS